MHHVWFIGLLGGGWLSYFLKEKPSTFTLILLLTLSAWWAFTYRRDFRKCKAANNAVVAAATFEKLSDTERTAVHERAIEIVRRSGWTGPVEPSLADFCARYGWYALAMAELAIKPAGMMPGWNYVRNPFTAIGPRDIAVLGSAIALARNAGLVVRLD